MWYLHDVRTLIFSEVHRVVFVQYTAEILWTYAYDQLNATSIFKPVQNFEYAV